MSESVDLLIAKLVHRLHDADPIVRRNAAGALRLHGRRATCAEQDWPNSSTTMTPESALRRNARFLGCVNRRRRIR